MEVLLFALFFISALIFFIAGKDDFGRTERSIIKEEKNIEGRDKVAEVVQKEDKVEVVQKEDKVAEVVQKEDKVAEVVQKENKVAEVVQKEDKVAEVVQKENKVAEEGKIEPQDELKKES
ncbi:hypothetical protein EU95_0981 [Prochlorococcus marinus str. MIT 9201]|uniref:Uncharacterized protein n=2 Tax=Prochlorococcus marinus TaxID=1219 RepID=A0A0A2A5T7_PROMR|nr:hypothetical protein [Prochlorococcus marinus]KGF96186.1 hypothetical protein EU95_0981 [Prochlorococcus marinus str. MIT 9201]